MEHDLPCPSGMGEPHDVQYFWLMCRPPPEARSRFSPKSLHKPALRKAHSVLRRPVHCFGVHRDGANLPTLLPENVGVRDDLCQHFAHIVGRRVDTAVGLRDGTSEVPKAAAHMRAFRWAGPETGLDILDAREYRRGP
jgi:hypothetical protein